MALTKGDFYHHFGSVPKFRMALLDWYEQRRTGAVIEAAGSLGPRDRLLRLLDEALKDTDDAPRPGPGGRDPGLGEPGPAGGREQERVDARRVGYLRELLAGLGAADPLRTATVVYVTMIGAAHLVPPLPKQEPRACMRRFCFRCFEDPHRRSSWMWHDIAPDAATAALAVIGALHVAWAFTPWPAPT